jgi:hypothetical protein
MGHKQMAGCIKRTFSGAAMAQAVISRVFAEDRRIREILKKRGRHGIREIRSITLGVPRGA